MKGTGSRHLVIDASVSLKWALDDEEATAEAAALLNAALDDGRQLVAPSLWLYEVTNGLVTAVRRNRVGEEAGSRALGLLRMVGVRLADPEAEDTYGAAIKYRIAAYDAAYLALAATIEADLWTGDRRFYDAVRESVDFVRWIGDYPL